MINKGIMEVLLFQQTNFKIRGHYCFKNSEKKNKKKITSEKCEGDTNNIKHVLSMPESLERNR